MGPRQPRRSKFLFSKSVVIMRKYIRLFLFAIAFISCSLMLIYQHKYSKLNVILQVMNAFRPHNSNFSTCNKKLQELTRSSRTDWTVQETISGLPTWTEIFPDIHMYSTFWFGNTSHTLTFVDGFSVTDIDGLTCKFLYNNGSSSDYAPASRQLFRKKKNFLFIIIKCKAYSALEVPPHSVVFQLKKAQAVVSMQVTSKQSQIGTFSMCVEPLPMGFNDVYRTIEFLVYHHHLGVNHFLFYDRGMSSTVKKLLLELCPKSNIIVTLLPWNVPFWYESASEHGDEYFVDCTHRVMSRNYSTFILNSNLNHFIVPKGVKNLTSLLSDEKLRLDPPRFYGHRFCLEYPDDTISRHLFIPFVTLLKDKMFTTDFVASAIYNVQQLQELQNTSYYNVLLLKGFPQKSSILPKHIAVIHSYQKCNDSLDVLQKGLVVNKYLWKYKNLFFKSKLYLAAKQQKLLPEK